MSRKSRRNTPPATSPEPAPRTGTRFGKGALIAIGLASLVVAFAAAVMVLLARPPSGLNSEAARSALASAAAPTLGNPEAPVHIVEFLDPACETCAVFYGYVKRMIADNPGRVRLTVRHVAFHKGADEAVRVLEAARAQGKYWQVLEALLANQDRWVANHRVQPDAIAPAIAHSGIDFERLKLDMAAPAVAERMQRDMADARTLQVTRTPEYFVNGRQMPQFGREELQALVDDELRRTARLASASPSGKN
jgi:protein-disulfide isomerase